MTTAGTSGRIEESTMRRMVASAAAKVAAAYGISAEDVGRSCSTRSDGGGYVTDAVKASACADGME